MPRCSRAALFACLVFGCFGGFQSQIVESAVGTQQALETFDRAIDALANQSANWQVVLQGLQADLDEDAQSTMRVELTNLMRTGQLGASGEFRCDAEFLRIRTQRELRRLRNELVEPLGSLGVSLSREPELRPEPHICTAVPTAINVGLEPERRLTLDVYGFDLRSLPITAELVSTEGTRRNITGNLGIISDQQMVLDLSDGGSALDDGSRRIVFSWGSSPQSVVPVLSPNRATPTCAVRTVAVTPDPVSFIPRHTRGDADYAKHGPCIRFELTISLDVEGQKLRATYDMRAFECNRDFSQLQRDFTTAEGSGIIELLTIENPADRIVGYSFDNMDFEYIDDGFEDDTFTFPHTNFIQELVFAGDTEGDEAGTATQVAITFREMNVKVEECTTEEPPGL